MPCPMCCTHTDHYYRQRVQEVDAFTAYRDEEIKKLKRERRIFDRHREAARSIPDKQEREALEQHRAEIAELRAQLKIKEEKAAAAVRRYKDTVKRLTEANDELQAEVAALERARLDDWGSRTSVVLRPTATGQLRVRPVAEEVPVAVQSTEQLQPAAWKDYSQGLASAPRQQVLSHPDGKVEKIGDDGRREVAFPNGTRKEISPDGFVVVRFFNGDVKRTYPNQKVHRRNTACNYSHTTHPIHTDTHNMVAIHTGFCTVMQLRTQALNYPLACPALSLCTQQCNNHRYALCCLVEHAS